MFFKGDFAVLPLYPLRIRYALRWKLFVVFLYLSYQLCLMVCALNNLKGVTLAYKYINIYMHNIESSLY